MHQINEHMWKASHLCVWGVSMFSACWVLQPLLGVRLAGLHTMCSVCVHVAYNGLTSHPGCSWDRLQASVDPVGKGQMDRKKEPSVTAEQARWGKADTFLWVTGEAGAETTSPRQAKDASPQHSAKGSCSRSSKYLPIRSRRRWQDRKTRADYSLFRKSLKGPADDHVRKASVI